MVYQEPHDEPDMPEQPGTPETGQDPAWYKLGNAYGHVEGNTGITPQPPPHKWYQFPPWGPGWPHVVGALSLATASLGFSIAAFSMALVVLLRMH